ncbi:hypothetical protein CLV97_11456 [Planifilum fimeticola]|uniref:Uncharacterized protein n=1 Tax=Planifilum fimeticola TaxID=201975 RepID=A0A2T0LE63_9BACL|nr:hypothetical protein [Planifilum fimeticola]PRX40368.1 hypothetical protein CLV97_11456 [Planifilum fimeticola]
MTEWPFFSILEWQIMTGITVFSTLLSWWKKRRWMQILSLACVSVLILSVSFREPVSPGILLPGIFLGSFTLLYMAKKILEPAEKR